MDQQQLKDLPDADLILASKGQSPGVPSWLALSELNSRNKIRAASPIATNNQTVASGVVAKTLAQSGVQVPNQPPPQSQAALGAPQPQQTQSQALQQPSVISKFSRGGVVGMATGGNPPASQNILQSLQGMGMAPSVDPNSIQYQPVQYSPAVTPDGLTLAAAKKAVEPIFGKDPGYADTLDQIKSNSPKMENQGAGNFLMNLVSGVLANHGNFGAGLGAANQAEQEGRANFFKQRTAQLAQELQAQKDIEDRNQAIGSAAVSYRNANAAAAVAQAKEQAEIARGNQEGAIQARAQRIALQQDQAKAVSDFTKNIGNPNFAHSMELQGAAAGDANMVALAREAQQQFFKNTQQEENIKESGSLALENQRFEHEKQLKNIDLHNKLMESGMGDTGGNGSMVVATGVDGKPVAYDPSSLDTKKLDGLKGVDPNNRLDAAAVHWITTNDVPFKGQGAASMNIMMQKRAAEIMAANGIQPEELTPIRASYKANLKSLEGLTTRGQALQDSERKIDAQLPNTLRAIDASSTGMPSLTSGRVAINDYFGGNDKIDRDSAINPIVTEYANFMGGGNKGATDAATAHARELLPSNATSSQARAAIENLKSEMRAQADTSEDSMARALQRTKLTNLHGSLRTNNPDYGVIGRDPGVVVNPKDGDAKIYNGRKYIFDGHQWVGQ